MATPDESRSDDKASLEAIIQALRALNENLDDSGTACFNLAESLYNQQAFAQVLYFGHLALNAFIKNDDKTSLSRLRIVDALTMLASSCFRLKKYDDTVHYLDRVTADLTQLLHANVDADVVVDRFIDAQKGLLGAKGAMGNLDEAVVHALTILDVKQRVFNEGAVELGDANAAVSEAYLRAFDHREALPFCLKAMEIYEKVHGMMSLVVAGTWRKLAVIHHGRKEYNDSIQVNVLAVSSLLYNTSPDSPDLLSAEVEGACTRIELGKYKEAVDMLTGVVARDDIGGWLKVKSFLAMARALCCLGNVSDAERYITEAQPVLEGIAIENPVLASIGYLDLSLVYKNKNDLDTAIAMMKTALAFPKLPKKLLLTLYRAFMSLISQPARLSEEASYLEVELEKLKMRFGLKHCVVGYGYANLGVAYFGSRQKEMGVKCFEIAKAILDDTLGWYYFDSLKMSHCLSLAFAKQGRYNEAMKVEGRVIEGINGRAQPSDENLLVRATKHLKDMKEIVADSPTREKVADSPTREKVADSPTRASGSCSERDEELAEKISQCGIKDEEKLI